MSWTQKILPPCWAPLPPGDSICAPINSWLLSAHTVVLKVLSKGQMKPLSYVEKSLKFMAAQSECFNEVDH